jgi:hypothetical protein
MAEEIKETKETKEVEKTDTGKVFKTMLKVLLGIALLLVGLWLLLVWKQDLFVLIKGGMGLFLILAGLITLAIAKE